MTRSATVSLAGCSLLTVALGAAIPLPALAAAQAQANNPDPSRVTLPTVVVTATRSPRHAFDVPASVNAVRLNVAGSDHANINPSEALRSVPGVLARDRQNYAQDEQISIRGFGARSSFGVRGVRLFVDGIPATMPDGQGQTSNFPLAAASRIEVLRGPFSTLYGNSSGGVIQIFTAGGTPWPEQRFGIVAGPYGAWHADANARGTISHWQYNADLEYFRTHGFRRHSAARRAKGNLKLVHTLQGGGKLTLLLNSVWLRALDPQGLSWQQYLADPRQAAPSAIKYDTRKRVRQTQGGVVYDQPLGDHQKLRVLGYYGRRQITQFLSVPVFAQASPLSSGGVIDLDTRYGGVDARWQWQGALLGQPLHFTVGINWDRENQHRLGFENFAGTQLGVVGGLRRNEQDDVYDFDQYAQGRWDFAKRWSLTAGVRRSRVHFSTDDAYVRAHNPDDSGRVEYTATTPVAGLLFHASKHWNLYASYGRGFETPTFSELAYRADGSAGLAFNLDAARTDSFEIGSKLRWADSAGKLDVALFESKTRDAIAVATSAGGRTTYRNVGHARRRGVEIDLDEPLSPQWNLYAAYTRLDARFTQVRRCVGSCAIVDGARIPGVARNQFYGELRWHDAGGWHVGVNVSALGAVVVDDANSAQAPGYAVVGLDMGRVLRLGGIHLAPFLRIDNLFDRRTIGAVIVNDRNDHYFEPAPGRSVMLGFRARFDERPVTR